MHSCIDVKSYITRLRNDLIDVISDSVFFDGFMEGVYPENNNKCVQPSALKKYVDKNEAFRDRLFETLMIADGEKFCAFDSQRMSHNISNYSFTNELDFDSNSEYEMVSYALGALNFADSVIGMLESNESNLAHAANDIDWVDFILNISNVVSNVKSHASFSLLRLVSWETTVDNNEKQRRCIMFILKNEIKIKIKFGEELNALEKDSDISELSESIMNYMDCSIDKNLDGADFKDIWDGFGEKICILFIRRILNS